MRSPIVMTIVGIGSFFLAIFVWVKKGFYHNGIFVGSEGSYIYFSLMYFLVSILCFILSYRDKKAKIAKMNAEDTIEKNKMK